MINSLDQSHQHQQLSHNQRMGNQSNPNGCSDDEDIEMDGDNNMESSDSQKLVPKEGIQSHSKTVQALRKYLQRKLSSEDSSSERESPHEKDVFHRSFESVGESNKSTLTCSIVYPSSGKSTFPLQKQRSLDDYTIGPNNSRYLRTDLCVPILLSRCTFCDQSFELEDELRAHMRISHWNYFLDKNSQEEEEEDSCSSSEVLDLSMRKLTDTVSHSLPNLESLSVASGASSTDQTSKSSKKPVTCITCGKGFSTKWNWKQHQKIHLRENLQAYLQ